MAIDDNASYELTGYQVKDLASKIRAKADSNSLASVATSGLYSDLTGAPTIPTVYNGTLTLQQNGSTLGTFSANQSGNETINFTSGGKLNNLWWGIEDPEHPDYKNLYAGDPTTLPVLTNFPGVSTMFDEGMIQLIDQVDNQTYVVVSIDSTNYSILAVRADGSSGAEEFVTFSTTSGSSSTWTKTVTSLEPFTGATSGAAGTSGLVPAPAIGDQDKVLKGDGTWGTAQAQLVEMSYGESNAWAKFSAAYAAKSIVYCGASSNANPGTGAKTRRAFMAYVNNETIPTEVEFQYVRSVGSKTSSQPVDQVFVYKLTSTNGGTWSVQTRDMAPKVAAGTGASVSYGSGTYTVGMSAMTGATSGAAGTSGAVPAPAAGDNTKFLRGDGTWQTLMNAFYPVGSIYMSATLSTAADVEAALGGTWTAWGAGRVPVGVDTNDTDFDTAEETGGAKTHTLTTTEMPSHSHAANGWAAVSDGSGSYITLGSMPGGATTYSTRSTGGGGAHNNLQPYITCYMYKRTA